MFLFVLVLGVFSFSFAQPNRVIPQNVITVPPNCPEGQELINGQCRDIWKSDSITPSPLSQMYGDNLRPKNMITVPPNCPPGQQLVNGQCRDIWRGGVLAESKLFEKLLEKQWAISGYIQNLRQAEDKNQPEDIPEINDSSRNIINIPNQCPQGYRPDALGICRKIF